jgi:O-antigen ligase
VVAVTIVAVLSETVTPARVARVFLLGALAAYGVGVVFAAIEVLTSQGLMRWTIAQFPALQVDIGKHTFLSEGTVVGLSEAMANRRTAIVALLLLPALLLLGALLPNRRGQLAVGALAGAAAVAVFGSEHQSSQLAAVLAAGLFAVAGWSPALARRIVLAGWIVATVCVVPLVLLLEGAGADRAAWMPESARQRIVIWGTTARATMAAPTLGIGADATPAAPGYRLVKPVGHDATTSVHAHNAYLQIWYELGAAGALLLAVTGLALVRRIGQANTALTERVALTQLTMIASMIATSYGIWQPWFLGAIGLSVVMTALVLRPIHRPPEDAGPRSRNG